MNIEIKLGTLPKAVHEVAVQDAQTFRSSQELRFTLIRAMRDNGKTSANFDADTDPAFYRELMTISRETMAARASDKGLTEEEKAQLPDGVYQVDVLLDTDIKPSQLPPFMVEPNRIGGQSIRRYWQMQAASWYRSVKTSMETHEKQMALLTGGAQARTKNEAELQAAALIKVVKRSQKSSEPVLQVKEVAYLVKIVNRLAEEHGTDKIETE